MTGPDGPPGRLRVLVLLQYYAPHRTGLTRHVQALAEGLVARGHAVTVIAARHDAATPRLTTEAGVRIRRLWAPLRISRGMVMPTHPAVVRAELRDADVVSVHTPMLETALVAVLAARRRVPMVITHHGDLVLPPGRWSQVVQRIVHAMHRVGARRAARVITYSEGYAKHSAYVRGVEDRTVAITPPVTVASPRVEGAAARRSDLAPDGGPLIGFVGRFVREKRPDVAIEAMDTVRAEFPHARLVFVGEYDIRYEDTWRRLAPLVEAHRDHLEFLGLVVDDQELADLYAAFDVVVLTSDTECFALVQVEAMLCGTPVVMTDVPGGREPVAITGMGRLATAGDPHAVGAAIVEVLRHRTTHVRSREHIDAALALGATLDRYEEVLRDAARRR